MAFNSRIRTYHAWQQADAQAKRAKQQHETARAQGKLTADQIPRSLTQVAEVGVMFKDEFQVDAHMSSLNPRQKDERWTLKRSSSRSQNW